MSSIPEEAVYAAASAVYGCGFDGSPQREAWLRDFRLALEAASPYLMATAYDEGAMDLGVLTGTSMSDDMIEIQRNNPYRTEQSTDF